MLVSTSAAFSTAARAPTDPVRASERTSIAFLFFAIAEVLPFLTGGIIANSPPPLQGDFSKTEFLECEARRSAGGHLRFQLLDAARGKWMGTATARNLPQGKIYFADGGERVQVMSSPLVWM